MASWGTDPAYVRGQRDGQILLLLKQHASTQMNNYKIWKACIAEIAEKVPEDVYYSAELIKLIMGIFIVADKNLDGHVSLKELLDIWEPKDAQARKELTEFFKSMDISGDQKLSLAEFFILGFLAEDRKAGYESAERVE